MSHSASTWVIFVDQCNRDYTSYNLNGCPMVTGHGY